MTLATRKLVASLWTLSGVVQWVFTCYMAGWWGWYGLSALVCFLVAGHLYNALREEETVQTFQTMEARLRAMEDYKQRLANLAATPMPPLSPTDKRRAH